MSWVLHDVRPYGEGEPVDVRIADGRIAEIGSGLTADNRLDGGGGVLLPGLVDLHTHLREPGREDAETVETGTLAAALGSLARSGISAYRPAHPTRGAVLMPE